MLRAAEYGRNISGASKVNIVSLALLAFGSQCDPPTVPSPCLLPSIEALLKSTILCGACRMEVVISSTFACSRSQLATEICVCIHCGCFRIQIPPSISTSNSFAGRELSQGGGIEGHRFDLWCRATILSPTHTYPTSHYSTPYAPARFKLALRKRSKRLYKDT